MSESTAVQRIDTETGEVPEERDERHQLARREQVGGLIRPVARPEEILEAQEETRELLMRVLKKGRDYDKIPGTKKDTLLQPGAERSAAAYGLAPVFEIADQEIDHDRPISYIKRSWEWGKKKGEKIWTEDPGQSEGLYRYVLRCQLVHRESGVVVGSGVGSCSTMESKYIDRPRDLENTVLKMAKKRAYVDSVLTTLGLHDQFKQDIEDNPEVFGAGNAAPAGPILEREVGFGKHKGSTWGQLVKDDPDYVKWAAANLDKLSAAEKKALIEALETGDRTRDALRSVTNDIDAALGNADATAYVAGQIQRSGYTDEQGQRLVEKMETRLAEIERERRKEAEAEEAEPETVPATGEDGEDVPW